uniref:Reverse transcriptase zinc-binding domain-containing protein n=1 Tax=Megaselia scalaris TaxID=36166 RepID=T1GEJ3_MEGSC
MLKLGVLREFSQTRKFYQGLTKRRNCYTLSSFCNDNSGKLINKNRGFRHCLVSKYLKYMGLFENDECRFCRCEDIIHIMCECPALCMKRLSIFGALH